MKRKYESERRIYNETLKGEDFRSERVKKAKYGRRKQRVRPLAIYIATASLFVHYRKKECFGGE